VITGTLFGHKGGNGRRALGIRIRLCFTLARLSRILQLLVFQRQSSFSLVAQSPLCARVEHQLPLCGESSLIADLSTFVFVVEGSLQW
jgi:hypothetical protein